MKDNTMLTRSDAQQRLRSVATASPKHAIAAAWKVLRELDGASSPDVCVEAVALLLAHDGDSGIVHAWSELPENVRRNVAYSTGSRSGLGTDTVERLFHARGTGVRERHLLVAGLVSTASERDSAELARIARLLDTVGSYDDEKRQRVLDRFLSNARTALGSVGFGSSSAEVATA